jgi:stage IV sporulation protein FB
MTPRPPSNRGELRFPLFGAPVRIQPWFWLSILVMSGTQSTTLALIWLGVCLVSILVHEMGHVFAFRTFGEEAEVVLYGFGGLTIPRRNVPMSTIQRVIISIAGPAAGFVLAIAVTAVAISYGAKIQFAFHSLVIPTIRAAIFPAVPDAARRMTYLYWNVLLNDLLFVNVYWGLVNLLPVFPLDGGHVSRALFQKGDPIRGISRSLVLSIATAGTLVVIGILTGSTYLALMFGILAAGNIQSFQAVRAYFRSHPDGQ